MAEFDALDETDPNEPLTPAEAGPNYNVAPTEKVLTVVSRHDRGTPAARRRIRRMRWGLVPHWTPAAEPGVPAGGKPLFNARADTAARLPSFRDAMRSRRCLIPMDGWYEWQVVAGADGKATKVAYFTTPANGDRLAVAGLWSVWRDPTVPDQPPLSSCTILTTAAVGPLQQIHDRMPLFLPAQDWPAWLAPDRPAPATLLDAPAETVVAGLEIRPVGQAVNSVRNNSPDLLRRADLPGPGEQISLL